MLRDSFLVHSDEFHATIRVTPAMRTAYTDCYRAAARNALRAAKVDWGGPLHFPWNSPEPCPDSLPDSYPQEGQDTVLCFP
ncbi:hypothetical protein DIPPA_07635 [Diplonema papillatum]|nr:hypothetical protein DIPPA_07635 [Diplonema papillatum]